MSAIIAGNDTIALGVLDAAKRLGISVPVRQPRPRHGASIATACLDGSARDPLSGKAELSGAAVTLAAL